MKFNFKPIFAPIALLVMLCFSFACAPTSRAESSVRLEKQSVKISPVQTAVNNFDVNANSLPSASNNQRNFINQPVSGKTKYGQSVTGIRLSYLATALTPFGLMKLIPPERVRLE